jgi:hypothetical protein
MDRERDRNPDPDPEKGQRKKGNAKKKGKEIGKGDSCLQRSSLLDDKKEEERGGPADPTSLYISEDHGDGDGSRLDPGRSKYSNIVNGRRYLPNYLDARVSPSSPCPGQRAQNP